MFSNSTIVQANAHTNSDLFKALKGGGPNYGERPKLALQTSDSSIDHPY